MAESALPSPELLRQLLAYDPSSGNLVWRERKPHHFKNPLYHAFWNRKNAGNRADYLALDRRRERNWMEVLILDKKYRAHRVIWAIHYGVWPEHQIDHINGDCADNRISNLRDVPDIVNKHNMPLTRRNRSGVIGVFFTNEPGRSKPWIARIRVNGKTIHIGAFKTKDEAAKARMDAETFYGFHPNHGKRPPSFRLIQPPPH